MTKKTIQKAIDALKYVQAQLGDEEGELQEAIEELEELNNQLEPVFE